MKCPNEIVIAFHVDSGMLMIHFIIYLLLMILEWNETQKALNPGRR